LNTQQTWIVHIACAHTTNAGPGQAARRVMQSWQALWPGSGLYMCQASHRVTCWQHVRCNSITRGQLVPPTSHVPSTQTWFCHPMSRNPSAQNTKQSTAEATVSGAAWSLSKVSS
jgi:hypothetical protein